ncbi:hypothetical protein [Microbispora sp. NBRC 16548]|uniref:hypothetical protein n=1 Tax=Microbispora sp. NBRC 16548 TaxID=3030994 RepID=UPI00249FEFC4|nr:hypothetical protein [Microbispora sp. NBRC 16548]GLX06718.1 hypothetical protein Misp03_36450 [Microbispora sp. NBRC 16548]
MTPLARFNELNRAHRDAFREAITRRLADVPGLEFDHGSSRVMTWLSWGGRGDAGYWVSAGLRHYEERPEDDLPAYILAGYVEDDGDDEKTRSDRSLLDVELPKWVARDADLHAAIIIAAVCEHGARNGLTAETKA